jgi:hypothetical protein
MFDWFRRSRKNREAEGMGRQAGAQFDAHINEILKHRFEPSFNAYLNVLQKQLNGCMAPTTVPPMIHARIQYCVFLENIDDFFFKMIDEIVERTPKWLQFHDEMNARDVYMALIRFRAKEFCQRLGDAGLERITDMAHALKAVDDEWRAANPEGSEKYHRDRWPSKTHGPRWVAPGKAG